MDDAHRDRELMMQLANGDQEALGALYDRHASTMMAVGVKILRNPREAEDLLHDVFVEAWQRADTYDPARGTVRAWLNLRMRSRCLDRVKSAAYRKSESLPERESAVGIAKPQMENEADGARLRAALDDLPDDQRAVLVLGYFEGLSSSEIAARLDIPIGTVKSRVAAAMNKMRQRLAEAGT